MRQKYLREIFYFFSKRPKGHNQKLSSIVNIKYFYNFFFTKRCILKCTFSEKTHNTTIIPNGNRDLTLKLVNN